MNNFSKVRLISKATLTTIKDNPKIIFIALLFFIVMLAPIAILWAWVLSQYPVETINGFFAGNWNGGLSISIIIALISSIVWGTFISYYFEFVITKILLQYWDKTAKGGIPVSKVLAYTGFGLTLDTIGSLLPGLFSNIYGIVAPALTSLIPVTILDNPNKSLKQTLQDNKDMFSKIGSYAVMSQVYLDFFMTFGLLLVIFCALFIVGVLIAAGLDVGSFNESGTINWITKLWNGYMIFAILSFMLSIVAVLFYRVLASIIVSTSLYIWYKKGNNPEEFQKVFLEKAMTAKKAEVFFN